MRVPAHLAHLRRDRRGLPVPYVNRYGSDVRLDRLYLARDPHVRDVAVFCDDYGDVPDFTRQHFGRQRETMIRGLCQVCGRGPLPWRRRFLVVAPGVSTSVVDGRPAVSEPWLCGTCVTFAVDTCPALIRRDRADSLHVVVGLTPEDCALVVSRGYVDGPLQAESMRLMPAMWAKVLLPDRVRTLSGLLTLAVAVTERDI